MKQVVVLLYDCMTERMTVVHPPISTGLPGPPSSMGPQGVRPPGLTLIPAGAKKIELNSFSSSVFNLFLSNFKSEKTEKNK